MRDVWVISCRTVFTWAVGAKLIARNPFVGSRITVPKKISTRETKALTENEIHTILNAAARLKFIARRTQRSCGVHGLQPTPEHAWVS